jgi:hypothetical protein
MPRWIGTLAWAWLIVLGALIITPIGPICIACGQVTSQTDYILGAVSVILGIGGLATQYVGTARA